MKSHKGFMLVHKHKFMKWHKPKARVFINTFDDSIVSLNAGNEYASFQTVEPGVVYPINCSRVDMHTKNWLYNVLLLDIHITKKQEKLPRQHVMCAKEL